jgi:hypothetical protein
MHLKPVYDLAEDELVVYDKAVDRFSQNRTYRMTKEPIRTSLQQQYACFSVDCYRRVKRNNRGDYRRNNEA